MYSFTLCIENFSLWSFIQTFPASPISRVVFLRLWPLAVRSRNVAAQRCRAQRQAHIGSGFLWFPIARFAWLLSKKNNVWF